MFPVYLLGSTPMTVHYKPYTAQCMRENDVRSESRVTGKNILQSHFCMYSIQCDHAFDFTPNCTSLSAITIIYQCPKSL